MKKTIMTIAALSVLAIATPAAAQYQGGNHDNHGYNHDNRGSNLDNRVDALEHQFRTGVARGTISRHEAAPLRERLRQLTRLERQYGRNGFNRRETSELRQRIQTLRQQISYAERNGNRRYDRSDRRGN